MKASYDYGLVGPNGQIGRALAKALAKYGTVYELARGEEDYPNLPRFKHLVNAAAFTKFNNKAAFYRYWDDNVLLPLKLAELANSMDAHYHHLSSHGVAEFRSSVLTEFDIAEPTARMKPYTLSKVLAEHLVRDTARRFTIYRCSDVIPSPEDLHADWRRNHWLSVLFAAGKEAFPDEEYPIWIADVTELANGIAMIADELIPSTTAQTHHLLGRTYWFGELRQYAADFNNPKAGYISSGIVDKVLKYVHIDPALASTVDSVVTHDLLPKFTKREASYWKEYAEISMVNPRT